MKLSISPLLLTTLCFGLACGVPSPQAPSSPELETTTCDEEVDPCAEEQSEQALSTACSPTNLLECIYGSRRVGQTNAIEAGVFYVPAAHRENDIPVIVMLPQGATGALPTIVFNHGGSMIPQGQVKRGVMEWGEALARGGYAVLLPTNNEPTVTDTENYCLAIGFTPYSPECQESLRGQGAFFRPQDVSAVIDAFAYLTAQLQDFGVELDVTRLGVGGWSAGSSTTIRVAGATSILHPSLPPASFEDPRPKAFIAMSPAGFDAGAFHADSWIGVDRPVFTATAEGDHHPARLFENQVYPHYNMPATGTKYQLYYNSEDTAHNTLNLEASNSNFHRTILGSIGLAFADAYILNKRLAREYLSRDIVRNLLGANPDLRTESATALDLNGDPVPQWSVR